jgi:hypothetical protein
MRRSMIAILAAVALSTGPVTAAIAAPHGGGGGGGHMSGGGGGHIGGFGGGGHMGGFGGGHIGSFGGGGIARRGIGASTGIYSPMRNAAPNVAANSAYAGRGNAYVWRGHNDHDRGHHRGFFFGPGYYSSLYAYQPNCNTGWTYDYDYNSCYDSDWND